MKQRKRVAVFIDYCIRIPNFQQSYQAFKEALFKNNFGIENDDGTENDEEFKNNEKLQDPVRFFWQKEIQNPEVLTFYTKKHADAINDYEVKGKYAEWFFNDAHYKRFLDEYSFNVFTDCEVPNKQDIQVINIAQTHLFDIDLYDRAENLRKVRNTFHFLATHALVVKSMNFILPTEEIDESQYIGIWDPINNSTQVNAAKSNDFKNWFMKLEAENKAK